MCSFVRARVITMEAILCIKLVRMVQCVVIFLLVRAQDAFWFVLALASPGKE